MKITAKGQVTIPRELRERLGLFPETEVEFVLKGNAVQIVKVKGSKSRGQQVVDKLRGSAKTKMTTDEIIALMRG
ncbi:MAG TPA: AbrB/MazE/SpoVT family DNA-binding domain-containing protein [Thermoanaerobaculia bacterium]|nr:AbrB/MazE/SpoVT family DNA-binding domain-containing protein [Thermoanaerobaculia bacterium]